MKHHPLHHTFARAAHICALVGAAALAWLGVGTAAVAQEPASPYRIVARQGLDGAVRWDYLAFEPASQRLFITHGDSVEVYDTSAGRQVGQSAATHGVHGVALAPALDRGYTSNGQANTVPVFELSTLQTLATVPTQENPDAIVYDPASQRVFAANGKSGSLTAIDAATNSVAGTVAIGGKLEFQAVDGQGRLYVNIEDRNAIAVVDTRTLELVAQYELAPACQSPTGLSIDVQGARLFVGCRNQRLAVVDSASGHLLATQPVGKGCDATAYDASRQEAYASSGDGTITVLSTTDYSVRQVVQTQPSARTMAVDPVHHRLFTVAAQQDPAPTDNGRPRLLPGTFSLLTIAR